MEAHGRTLVTALAACCFLYYIASFCVVASKAVSQRSPANPMIYVDIPRWEDRTSHARFIHFREQVRKRWDPTFSEEVVQPELSSYSRGGDSSSVITHSEDNQGSLRNNERDGVNRGDSLESRRNGIPTTYYQSPSSLSKKSPEKKSIENDSGNGSSHFMTSHQKQAINFPKDKTNPYNRLQIHPESADGQGTKIDSSASSSSSQVDSSELEISNRENFGSISQNEEEPAPMPDLGDAVMSFELCMNIVKLSNWEDENIVFSPFSIVNVLSMLLLGAGGRTLRELSAPLQRNGNATSLNHQRYHESFSVLLDYLQSHSGKQVALSIASEVFVDKRFSVKSEFESELADYYKAPLEAIDFGKDGELFQNKVNQWVQEKTHNKIKSILDEPPSPSTSLGIINAIYFKGPWEVPFSEKVTRTRDFYVNRSEIVKAQMMLNILELPYVDREDYRMVGIPYRENKTGFFVILPKGEHGINDLKKVEKLLTRQKLNESISHMTPAKVTLSMPKIKFSSDGRMGEVLRNMGILSLFEPARANFSKISSEGLYLSSLVHRAVVEVNEKGTEAAAVSLGTGDRILEDNSVTFKCDKPFIFFIYHMKADTVLFWGRVTRPNLPSI